MTHHKRHEERAREIIALANPYAKAIHVDRFNAIASALAATEAELVRRMKRYFNEQCEYAAEDALENFREENNIPEKTDAHDQS